MRSRLRSRSGRSIAAETPGRVRLVRQSEFAQGPDSLSMAEQDREGRRAPEAEHDPAPGRRARRDHGDLNRIGRLVRGWRSSPRSQLRSRPTQQG
jgi:hypothetical protein